MMCSNCNELVELNILSPTTWEFVIGYPFLITQADFYKDKSFNEYTKTILIAYANNEITHKELKSFIELGFYKEIPVKTFCSKCNTIFETFRLCYYGTIYNEYCVLLEYYFLQAFKEHFHANGSFLYENKDEIPYLTQLFFQENDTTVKQLYRLIAIHQDIPCEKGGDGEELLLLAVRDIALGLFGSFLYQIFLQDITENLKNKIKEELNKLKQINHKKEILKQLKRYMENEHVEWDEERAVKMIQDGLDNLIEKYIESLY